MAPFKPRAAALAAALAAACLASCSDQAFMPWYLPEAGDGVEVFKLESAAVGAEFTIYVGLPEGYGSGSRPYPLVFLTDADSSFTPLRKSASRAMAEGRVRDSILVGIGYGRGEDARARDFTPTRDAAYEAEQVEGGLRTGGAEAFLRFISDELLPRIEASYRAAPGREERCLLGHSLGGLLALYASVERPELFGSIVASSPSMYWDSRVIFRFLAERSADPAGMPPLRLFASSAEREGFPTDVELDEWLRRAGRLPSFSVDRRLYADAVHLEVWKKAWPDGLEAVFGEE